ncbi:MAG: bifunctional acetate--CoA ligase family protein/GNAT family N-acetyltransferase [Betaproteobacteria bacterium]|nr:bifunctional acetate--CoA ligase family protein/GNAT family N-acetyltransferase [Betaproteobacteria bacterium]
MTVRNLQFLFRPRSLAVIGASNRVHSVGGMVMRNLLKGGFGGSIFPVSRKGAKIAGVPAYRDVAQLPEAPDLALICTPSETLPQIVHELGERGTRAIAIVASTLHTPGEPEGDSPQQAILSAARPHLLRILGPDSMGLVVPELGLNAGLFPTPAKRGHVAFVSQSGTLTAAALDWAASRGIGFSSIVCLGDAVDVDAADTLDYLGTDPDTRAVLLYIESTGNARKFLSAARSASRNKPVVVLKAGRTAAGAQAAMRHTGSHPGNDQVFDAAIRRAGMLRVRTIAELFAAAETLARGREPNGERMTILTNAGGPGVVATDALITSGGELAMLTGETTERLGPLLPPSSHAGNPIDLGGDATPERYAEVLGILLNEPVSDAVLLINGPSGAARSRQIGEACAAVVRKSSRNVLACWMGGEGARRSSAALRGAGVAVHATPEAAVEAFMHGVRHKRSQEALQEAPSSLPSDFAPDRAEAESLLHQAAAAKRVWLGDPEGKMLLAAYGIPTVATHVASTVEAAVEIAARIGFPVALKVLSPELEHRADVGGVMLNLESEDEVRRAAGDISRRMKQWRPDASLAGFAVQRMIRRPGTMPLRHSGHELVVEAIEDAIFGPVIHLRPAGRADSAAVGLVPLNASLACEMIATTRLSGVLAATRNRPAADVGAIATVLTRVSQLLVDRPEIVEIRIDPLLCDDRGAMALEVLIRLEHGRSASGCDRLAIRPYPKQLEEFIELRDHRFLLRPIRPEDARLYAEFIARTDSPDILFRFFTLIRQLPARDLARYTQIDYDRDMAFVAVDCVSRDGGQIVGEVRAFRYPDSATAEFAILVRSDMKQRGLGRALLQKMIAYCRASGVQELIGQIRSENRAMIVLAQRCGMTVEAQPGMSIAVAHLDLQKGPP